MKDERIGVVYSSSWYFDMTCLGWENCYSRLPLSSASHDFLWGLSGTILSRSCSPEDSSRRLATAWEAGEPGLFDLNMFKRLVAVAELFWSPHQARAAVLPRLRARMGATCQALDAAGFFADVEHARQSHFGLCSDPPPTNQRNTAIWIQRQTERDMYVCQLLHLAATGQPGDCRTPYCQRNRCDAPPHLSLCLL